MDSSRDEVLRDAVQDAFLALGDGDPRIEFVRLERLLEETPLDSPEFVGLEQQQDEAAGKCDWREASLLYSRRWEVVLEAVDPQRAFATRLALAHVMKCSSEQASQFVESVPCVLATGLARHGAIETKDAIGSYVGRYRGPSGGEPDLPPGDHAVVIRLRVTPR